MSTTGCLECDAFGPAIDPLVVARIHNKAHSLLGRLPDEVLVRVLRYLRDDDLAPFCIGRVSSRLRRLLRDHNTGLGWEAADFEEDRRLRGRYTVLALSHPERRKELLARLWRDQLCATCLAQCRVNMSRTARAGETCKFSAETRGYCYGCRCLHLVHAFSPSQLGRSRPVCVGREGFVKLCEHRQFSWSEVEEIVAQATASDDAHDWSGRVVPEATCDDPSHTRCPFSRRPHFSIWWLPLPGPQIDNSPPEPNIQLAFMWEEHNIVPVDNRGQFNAQTLRAMFQGQEGAREIMRPRPGRSEWLMGMRCFSQEECTCVHCEAGDRASSVSEPSDHESAVQVPSGYKGCLDTNKERHRPENGGRSF